MDIPTTGAYIVSEDHMPSSMYLKFTAALCALVSLLTSCSGDEKIIPSPAFRAKSMSQGAHQYQALQYDDDGRIMQVISGTVDEEADSAEVVYQVIYDGTRITKIIAESNAHEYRYRYDGDRITETREYLNDQPVWVNEFYYDANNRVDVWVVKQVIEGEPVPSLRKSFAYDDSGNTVSMELETYDAVTKGHAWVSTSTFLDFDDKKNSSSLFMNLTHPYYNAFKNNARTYRIEAANGSVGETHYAYEYNDSGYTTVQRDVTGAFEVKYQFAWY